MVRQIELDDVLKILTAVRNSTSGSTAPADGLPTPGPVDDPAITKAPPYGHQSTLTPEQAHAFQMMMLIQGHNGDTIGRGRVIEHSPHAGNETVDEAVTPAEGE